MKAKSASLLFGFLVYAAIIPSPELLAAPYYAGKVMTLVVGSPAGGGNDRTVRLLARHLPKHIPGKPTIVVQNMPAGAGMGAANHLYVAKPDGLTIGTILKSLVFSQLLKAPGVKFDVRKYSWLGSQSVESSVFTIRSDLPYKTIQELQKAKQTIFLAGQGATTFGTQWTTMLIDYLGLNAKIVDYRGTPETVLALERKEVDGSVFAYNSARPYMDRGLLRPLVRTRISYGVKEDLPNVEDLTNDKTAKLVMAVHGSVGQAARPFVGPPGIPADILNILTSAFAQTIRDPAMIADAKKSKMDVYYVSPEDCLQIMDFALSQPEGVVNELAKYVKF